MPFIKFSQMIFTSEKHLIDADIRIDDSIKNLYGNSDMKLLFTSYHNTNFKDDELAKEGIKRVDNWIEIEKLLLK
jgi:5'(3')-deoxyribonucleotidase